MFFETNKTILYYEYYFFFLKIRLTVFTLGTTDQTSIDSIYTNAAWLERESAEMYGLYFKGKRDQRKLLLDYSRTEAPMIREFSTEGSADVFYNLLDAQVNYTADAATVEL